MTELPKHLKKQAIGNLVFYAIAGAFFGIGVRETQNRLTG